MNNLKRINAALACLSLLLMAIPPCLLAQAREFKIRGYITSLSSPKSFEIAEYKISRDDTTALELVDQGPDVQFLPEDFRVGTEVEVTGDYHSATNELKARKVKIDLDQFRKQKQRVILDRKPETIERVGQNWRALMLADGRRIRIEPLTQVTFALSRMEKEYLEREARQKGADKPPGSFHALSSLDEVGPGVLMTYEGIVAPDGSVTAASAEFMRNGFEKDEDAVRDIFRAHAKLPEYDKGKAGKLTMQLGVLPVDFKIVPSQLAQDYINKLGQSLIPASQRALPDSDPTKVPFKFFIIEFKEPIVLGLSHGEVAVTTAMLNLLENEAQLASLISKEVAHVVQKHQYWQFTESKQKRMSMVFGRTGSYSHLNERQADRLGLQYMTAAGYDPREALRAWALIASKHASDSDTISRAAEHRSYLMLELKNNYANYDYGAAKKNQDELKKIADLLNSTSSEKARK
ncbi:MAG: hypothetical protein QOD00_3056 [Blastocatellia bacterium]|jgi:hypothetical protein|nr:hypothetical protein [Blastocatellia bacterium]